MKRILAFLSIAVALIVVSCSKEKSLENAEDQMATGTLQDDGTGECLPKTVQGAYFVGVSLTSSNFIQVDVDVTKKGPYKISTDTINGYYFSASGEFSGNGMNTVKLIGKGKPLAEGSDIFTVFFDSSFCDVEVTVLPASANTPATFTLQSSGTDCMNAVVDGDYVKGVALNASNTVDIDVNVTAIGTYSISTTATSGMTFTSSGVFSATGDQTITLLGTGTPTNSGTFNIPVSAGGTSCSFAVDVAASGTTNPPASTYYYQFTLGGKTYKGSVSSGDTEFKDTTISGFTFSMFYFEATNAAADSTVSLTLADISGGIKTNDTYSSPASTGNAVYFTLEAGGEMYETSSTSFNSKVTALNTTSKIIEGTFSGTIKEMTTGATKTITNGQFKVNYQ